MAGRLRAQRAVVTDCGEYNGADIVALSQEEGADVVASHKDLTEPGAAEALMRRADRVDILTANLARPFSFRPAVEQGDDEMQRLMEATFCPLHRLVCAVTPQMLERKRGKIVAFGNTEGIKGRGVGVALYGVARGAQHAYMGNTPKDLPCEIRTFDTCWSRLDPGKMISSPQPTGSHARVREQALDDMKHNH